jgi:hypothetical protein
MLPCESRRHPKQKKEAAAKGVLKEAASWWLSTSSEKVNLLLYFGWLAMLLVCATVISVREVRDQVTGQHVPLLSLRHHYDVPMNAY